MTLNEIVFLIVMPILLFYFIQVILLGEFYGIAKEMWNYRNIFTLLCKYDECKEKKTLTCLSREGAIKVGEENTTHIDIPIDCHENSNIIFDNKGLNPFRRVKEDFIVMTLSINIPIFFLQVFGFVIIPEELKWDTVALYIITILTVTGVFMFSHEYYGVSALLVGIHVSFGLILFWTIRIFGIKWTMISNIENIPLLNYFSQIPLPLFIMLSIWFITLVSYFIWKYYVMKKTEQLPRESEHE